MSKRTKGRAVALKSLLHTRPPRRIKGRAINLDRTGNFFGVFLGKTIREKLDGRQILSEKLDGGHRIIDRPFIRGCTCRRPEFFGSGSMILKILRQTKFLLIDCELECDIKNVRGLFSSF